MSSKKIIILALAFLVSWGSSGQTSSGSLLWKIEGNNIQPSYVYGTIHLLPQTRFKLQDKVREAFTSAQQIVLELDIDQADFQTSFMKNIPMKDGKTLQDLMDQEDYQKLDAALQNLIGSGIQPFNTWKPIGISSLLIMQFIDGPPASFERSFVSMAKEQEKELLGLETVEEQMAAFDNIPYQEQIDDIMEMLDQPDRSQGIFMEMVEQYLQEDVEGLYRFTTRYLDTEEEINSLLHVRNRNWIPRIGELAKENSTFFGVGAAHLGGEQGILNLLQEAGYTLTPVY